ncbi:sortase-associated OmpA-like protein PdsO [Sulfuriflexus mobilis]|uniref:sortase-associated OmpA-like protein PdsO n=1 Tax=Sulfuriflexus mobilis TaxID=1811807 RepID=UPI000F84D4EE|nr:sortase-associated OmpA-like protein PdsO [Sulfuriflexus mobilis]
MMKKTIIAISLAAVMGSTNTFASDIGPDMGYEYQPTREDAGLGIGLLAGALVGGPIGFVVGGLIGAQAGQTEDYKQQLTEKDQQLAALRKDITHAQSGMAKARIEVSRDSTLLHKVTSGANRKAVNALASGMRVDVQFRTNSSNIEPHYTPQLQRVIAVMKLFPEVDIQLAGHADPRGADTDNLALSTRRINSIRQMLVKAGIKNTRIHATAWGERNTISTPSDIEAYAFDRRVVINFITQPSDADKAASLKGAGKRVGSIVPVGLRQQ